MGQAQPWDRQAVHDELDRVQADFHRLLSQAAPASLARRTDGTRWTNEQLLFHMLFGYIIVRALLPLMGLFGRLPAGFSHVYARLLNAATRPFDLVNYLGPCAAVHIYGHQRMAAKLATPRATTTSTAASSPSPSPRETAAGWSPVPEHLPAPWPP